MIQGIYRVKVAFNRVQAFLSNGCTFFRRRLRTLLALAILKSSRGFSGNLAERCVMNQDPAGANKIVVVAFDLEIIDGLLLRQRSDGLHFVPLPLCCEYQVAFLDLPCRHPLCRTLTAPRPEGMLGARLQGGVLSMACSTNLKAAWRDTFAISSFDGDAIESLPRVCAVGDSGTVQ